MKVTLECKHTFKIEPWQKDMYIDGDYKSKVFCTGCAEINKPYQKVVSVE